MAIKFDVKSRVTGKIQFTAQIECEETAPLSVKIGLAMKWGHENDASLNYASLNDARLNYASLIDAKISQANFAGASGITDRIIDGGLRSDGYRFFLTRTEPGEWRIKAGCQNLTLAEAKKHWDESRPKGTALGDETRLIIKHMLSVAKLRKWPKEGEAIRETASETEQSRAA